MSSSPVIDTSTISPLIVPASSSGYSPMSTSQREQVAPMTLSAAQAASLTPSSGGITIPDVNSMEAELHGSDPIPLASPEAQISTSPLTHLQPSNLAQTPEGTLAAVSPAPVPTSSQAIQLASTAPALRTPTLTQVVYQAQAQKEKTDPAHHYIISGILIVLTVVSISVLTLFIFQQQQIAKAEAAAQGTTHNTLLDFVIQNLPFVGKDTETQTPEAIWYQ